MNRSIVTRAAGIILTDGLMLLQKKGRDEFWVVPCGGSAGRRRLWTSKAGR